MQAARMTNLQPMRFSFVVALIFMCASERQTPLQKRLKKQNEQRAHDLNNAFIREEIFEEIWKLDEDQAEFNRVSPRAHQLQKKFFNTRHFLVKTASFCALFDFCELLKLNQCTFRNFQDLLTDYYSLSEEAQRKIASAKIRPRHFFNFCSCSPFFFDPRVSPFVKMIETKARDSFEAIFWKIDIRRGIFSKYTSDPKSLRLKIFLLDKGVMKISVSRGPETFEFVVSQDFPILVTADGHNVFMLAGMWLPREESMLKVTFIRYNEVPSKTTKWKDGMALEFKFDLPMKGGDFAKPLKKFGLRAIALKKVLLSLSKKTSQNRYFN